MQRWQTEGAKPLCKTEQGCPIQEEAQNPFILRLISGYMRYKQLSRAEAPEHMRMQALEACGATPLCPDFLCAMEPVFNELIQKNMEEEKRISKVQEAEAKRVAEAKARAKAMSRRRR